MGESRVGPGRNIFRFGAILRYVTAQVTPTGGKTRGDEAGVTAADAQREKEKRKRRETWYRTFGGVRQDIRQASP